MPFDTAQLEIFVLVFIRIVSAFAVMPVFGHLSVPAMVKAGLAAILALLLILAIPFAEIHSSGTILDFARLAVLETVCGILIGFIAQAVFFVIEMAGQLTGYQAGFTFVSSVDPNTESQSTVISQFYNILAMLIFLTINGHHWMLQALADSFRAIPLGALDPRPEMMSSIVAMAGSVVKDGVQLAAPLMVTLLVTDVCFGFLTRVAPSLNVFVLGFPVKIGITLLMISAGLNSIAAAMQSQMINAADQMPEWFRMFTAK